MEKTLEKDDGNLILDEVGIVNYEQAMQELAECKEEIARLRSSSSQSEREKELESKRRLVEVLRREKESLEKKVHPLEVLLEEQKRQVHDLTEECRYIGIQFDELKAKVYQSEEEKERALAELSVVRSELQMSLNAQRELEEKLGTLAKEEEAIKHHLLKGQKEVNALKLQYQNALQEKGEIWQKLSQMQQHAQYQKEVWLKQIEEMRKGQADQQEFSKIKTELEQQIDHQKNLLNEKDQLLKELEGRVTTLLELKYTLQQKADSFDSLMREKDADIKEAEQHLAKKVKESAYILEQNEEQKNLIAALRHEVEVKGAKFAEVQGLLEAKSQNEARLQEQIERLEEKYLKVHEKLQKSESKLQTYKGLEEKHSQMKNLLANLGNFIESESHEPKKPLAKTVERLKTTDMELDLFANLQEAKPVLKESFFD